MDTFSDITLWLRHPPPLRHPDRAAWNRALDHHLDHARAVLVRARDRAAAHGDRMAEDRAARLLRRGGG